MRFQEGMRRVGLVLGALGFLGCCWIAVIAPGDIIFGNLRKQREFASVMRTPLVKKVLADVSKHGVKDAIVEIPSPEIRLIHVGRDGEVLSFDRNDGTTIYKPDANSAWMYLTLVLLPVSGFFVPWSVARVFTWIVSGFLDPKKQRPVGEG